MVQRAGCGAFSEMLEISCCALIYYKAGAKLPDSHQGEEKKSLKTLSCHWHGFQVLKDFGKKGQPLLRYLEIRAEWATLPRRLWKAVFPLLNLSGNVHLACSGQIISDNPWQSSTVSRGAFWAWRCQQLAGDVREYLGASHINSWGLSPDSTAHSLMKDVFFNNFTGSCHRLWFTSDKLNQGQINTVLCGSKQAWF